MSRRRRLAVVTTWMVVLAWVVFDVVAVVTADQPPGPVTAVAQLVVPPLLWVALLQLASAAELAARQVLRRWRSRRSATDLPGRLLAATAASLPDRRREWGRAMTAELAQVHGRSARCGSRSAVPGPHCGRHRRPVGRCSGS